MNGCPMAVFSATSQIKATFPATAAGASATPPGFWGIVRGERPGVLIIFIVIVVVAVGIAAFLVLIVISWLIVLIGLVRSRWPGDLSGKLAAVGVAALLVLILSVIIGLVTEFIAGYARIVAAVVAESFARNRFIAAGCIAGSSAGVTVVVVVAVAVAVADLWLRRGATGEPVVPR